MRLPYYSSMSPSQDATIDADTSPPSGGDVLEGEYRERWHDGGMWLQGSVAHTTPTAASPATRSRWYRHLFGSGRVRRSPTIWTRL